VPRITIPAPPREKPSDAVSELLAAVGPLALAYGQKLGSDRADKKIENMLLETESLAGARLLEATRWSLLLGKQGVPSVGDNGWLLLLKDAAATYETAVEARLKIASGLPREPDAPSEPPLKAEDAPACTCGMDPYKSPESHPETCALGAFVRKHYPADGPKGGMA